MSRTDDVFVIDVGDDENMTSVAWVAAMNELLDEVEAAEGPKALVTTSSAPKHFSNGLDTPWMATAESGDVVAYVDSCFRLVHRIMLLGVPTAAAVTGHAFGLGAFVVLAHDQAVMREDRGFWNLPEVHLAMNFPPGLMNVARSRIAASELARRRCWSPLHRSRRRSRRNRRRGAPAGRADRRGHRPCRTTRRYGRRQSGDDQAPALSADHRTRRRLNVGSAVRDSPDQPEGRRSRGSPCRPEAHPEAEHLLAEDVLHDLGGAAFDGVGPSPQEGVADTGTGAGEVDLAGATEGVVELDLTFHALQVDGLFEDGLVECGHHRLADGAFRPGLPAFAACEARIW